MNARPLSDQQLLSSYFSGNSQAISTLIERHRKRVFDYIHMMVRDRDAADDIFQDTLIKAIRFLDEKRYVDNGKFVSWLLRIAHNQVIDYFRHVKQENKVNASDTGYDIMNNLRFSDPTVEDKIVSTQIEEDVRRLVQFLPDEQKEVVLLRYFNNLSFKEIAEQTNVSINTALGRMRYALINLRKMIHDKQLILS